MTATTETAPVPARQAAGIVPAVAAATAVMLAYALTVERFRRLVRDVARRAAATPALAPGPGLA